MILMIDNYDSFTYNLVQYLGEMGQNLKVVRNDKISVNAIRRLKPRSIVISPGPGMPQDAGISVEVVRAFAGKIPILGVCLGHQAIGVAFGCRIVRARRLMHGKTSMIRHNKKDIFKGLPDPFEATRYHSLIIEPRSLSADLNVTAWTREKEIMGVRHKRFPVFGVQFHPESIMTGSGKKLLKNFIRR